MKREDIKKILKDIENRTAKEKKAAMYKDIEERKRQFVCNMEEYYICIDDVQGGKIAIKKNSVCCGNIYLGGEYRHKSKVSRAWVWKVKKR